MSDLEKMEDHRVQAPEVTELPERVLQTYARVWQLEVWLRRMVYVELRAQFGDDWSSKVEKFNKSLEADKQLTHMPTVEEEALSYAPFSELRRLISEHWILFKPYLPPKTLWEAKLEEVAQVRNRVAHFRRGHTDDYGRVIQLLRDIDRGFWTFCTSYNDARHLAPDDPVASRLIGYDPFPSAKIDRSQIAWIGDANPSVLAVTAGSLMRHWISDRTHIIDGKQGYLYDVSIIAQDHRNFEHTRFLKLSKSIHSRVCHICLESSGNSVRLTIPAVLGASNVLSIVERAMNTAMYSVQRGPVFNLEGKSIQQVADSWPEYVLGPENPLTFLSPDMPATFFSA